jgi:hypothetical protein
MDAEGGSAHHSHSVHFLIWLSETERMCGAVRGLAAEYAVGPLGEQTIAALTTAHRGACGQGVDKTTFRFQVPTGAEHLMAAAAIRVRRDQRHPFGLFLSLERAERSA